MPPAVYQCKCETCDYDVEIFGKRKVKRARNYHKYKHPNHKVGWEQVAGPSQAQRLKDMQAVTRGNTHEFEEEYQWWMWFYKFR